MIPVPTNPRPVRVGHWHIQRQEVNHAIPHGSEGYIIKPYIKEVRFDGEKDYTGLLHGFGSEGEFGEGGEQCVVALVEKPDGTFDTPSVTVIQLLTPTLSGPA